MSATVRNTATHATIIVCPQCPHQTDSKAVTSQEWTDVNGDVYFAASQEETPNALMYFIAAHNLNTVT
jgi:hypothetical protein